MNKTTIAIITLVLFAIIGWQTYMIYTLRHQVQQLSGPFTGNDNGSLFTPTPPDLDFFNNNHWDPYQEMQRMQQEMEHSFNNAFSRMHMHGNFNKFTKMPALNLKEEADRYVVTMDMPGADLSSLSVNLNGRQLTIAMNTERSGSDKNKQFQRQERFSGTFQRSLTLPGPVKEGGMKSDYKDGVLTVDIPKA